MTESVQQLHSPIGASSCERWWNCPGSVRLLQTVPPFEGSKYTAEGTVAHSLGERALNTLRLAGAEQCTDYDLSTHIGQSYVEDGFEIEVTEDMVEAVEVYVNTVAEYLQKYNLQWAYNLHVEIKFDLTHIDPEAFGTCDALLVAPYRRLMVFDYKHGAGHAVEVINNHQLLYYGLGAWYKLTPEERDGIDTIELIIVQPRARHDAGSVRSWTISVTELLAHEVELRAAISRVRHLSPELFAGSHCKWCNAKPVCPEQRSTLENLMGVSLSTVDTKPIELPPAQTLTPEKLAMLMENASTIKNWLSSVVSFVTASADNGAEITGFKLVTKFGRRTWKDERAVEAAFANELGDELYNKKLKTPAQLEKKLGKKRKEELEDLIFTPVTGKTLVPESDDRPSAENDPSKAFSKIGE